MWSAPPSATYLVQFCRLGHQTMWVWSVKKVCEMWQSDLERGGDGDSRHTCDKTHKHMHTPSSISNGFSHWWKLHKADSVLWCLMTGDFSFWNIQLFLHYCRRLTRTVITGRFWCSCSYLQGLRRRLTQGFTRKSHYLFGFGYRKS